MSVCCFAITLVCIFKGSSRYFLLFTYPLLYLVFYFVIYRYILFAKNSIFKLFLGIMLFLRYVIMPFLNVLVGYSSWCKNIPTSSNYLLAQIMMIVEMIIIIVVFKFNYKKRQKNNEKIKIDNRFDFVILLFSIISIVLFFCFKSKYNILLHIVIPKTEFSAFESNNIKQILILLFNTAKAFLFLLVLKKVYLKPKKTIFDVLLVLFFCVLNVFIYTGTNRIQLIISFISSIYLILLVFPKLKKFLIISSLISFAIILPAISSFRQAELVSSESTLYDYSQLLNAYLGGVDNVAISVETADVFPQYRSITNFFYDMFRGVLGFNVILKNNHTNVMESDLYNFVYFGHGDNASQIVPIVGQGYFYFDIVGFWIIELFFLILGLKLEKLFNTTTNFYLKYTLLVILLRFSIMQGLSGTILAHSISFDCFIPWIIIMLNNYFVFRKDTLTYDKSKS